MRQPRLTLRIRRLLGAALDAACQGLGDALLALLGAPLECRNCGRLGEEHSLSWIEPYGWACDRCLGSETPRGQA